jgi:tetratricopeptide (TPR) repeat protein
MLSSTGSLTSGSTISSNEQVDLPSGFDVVTEQDGRPPLQKAKSEMVPFSASALSSKQARPRRPSVTTTNGTNDATLAKSFKDKAIKAFRGGHYQEAAEFYTAALEVLPQVDKEKGLVSSLYSNRAATYLRLNEFSECINDADEALRLDYNNVKVRKLTSNNAFRSS